MDDPLWALTGSHDRRRLLAARFMLTFIVLGARLAFLKAQLSRTVTSIGDEVRMKEWSVSALVP